MSTPTRIRNSEFVPGGIYPGGTGIVTDIGYKLWDYNGYRPKDSEMCVEMTFTPTDGSGDGNQPQIVNWNVGPASSFMPDPKDNGFALTDTGKAMVNTSNWHFAVDHGFVKNCGMKPEQLDGPKGLKILIGSELTLVRMDPPNRDFSQTQAPAQPGQPQRKNQVLIPTRAKFEWERGGRSTSAITITAATGTAPAPTTANSNGHDLTHFISTILSSNSDYIDMKDFPGKIVEAVTLAGVKGKDRVSLIKQSKDAQLITALAASNNWTLDEFTAGSDGTMTGSLSR